jgi:hypothetical protein
MSWLGEPVKVTGLVTVFKQVETAEKKHFSLSSNYWQLWKKTSALPAILDN